MIEFIACGIERQNLDHFDDQHSLKQQPSKITSIKVSVSEQSICGIQFTYKELESGKIVHGHNSCHSSSTIKEYVFQIPEDDFLQVVFGYFEESIHQLGFVTYKGKTAIFGQERGAKFTHLHMGFTYSAAYGQYQKNQLDFLALRVCKLPKIFIEINFQPLIEIIYKESINPYASISFGQKTQQEVVFQQNPYGQEEIIKQNPYGQEEIIKYNQYGQQEIIKQNPYGQEEVIFQQNPYGQEEIIRQNPYGQQEIIKYNQYGQEEIIKEGPYGQQEIIKQNPYGQEEIITQNAYGQQQVFVDPYAQPYPNQNQIVKEEIIVNQYGQQEVIVEKQQRPPQVIIEQTPYGPKEVIVQPNNEVVVVNEQQQMKQKQGMGVGGAMMVGALGTMAAIETAEMIDHHHHHHHHRDNVVVVETHHRHHRRD